MIVNLLKIKFNIDYAYGIETNNESIVLTKLPILEYVLQQKYAYRKFFEKKININPFFQTS